MRNDEMRQESGAMTTARRMRRTAAALLATSSLCLPTIAVGQIAVADQATAVRSASNGVPVVDIAAPNANGLSHNRFTDYNVDTRGLVLNNNASAEFAARQSQLAGQVSENTRLGGNAATVILNEVTSTNRSTLNGFTEVLGARADVIVANPNGITCGGCGFINSPNVTMTTGRPTIDANGRLTALRVTGGDILVTGAGLNASGQDYLALVARRIRVEAPINANTLDMAGGAGDWNIVARSQSRGTGEGTTPLVAIDSAAVGGMYAGRVRLIVTEAGAGVAMAGDMAAGAGDFTIDAAGKVQLGGTISATSRVSVASGGGDVALDNARVTAGSALALDGASGALTLTGGLLNAGTTMAITAASLTDAAGATAFSDANKRFAKDGIRLDVTGAAGLDGTSWGSDGAVGFAAGAITISSGSLYAATASLRATTGDLALGAASLRTAGALTLDAARRLSGSGIVLSTAGDIALSGAQWRGSGTISADKGALTLAIRDSAAFDGTLQAGGTLRYAGGALDTAGTITGVGGVFIDAASLTNAATVRGAAVTVTAGGLANSGEMAATGALTLTARDATAALANTGTIRAATTTLAAAGVLANSGTIAGDTMLATGATVTNRGRVESAGALSVTGTDAITNDGAMVAGGALVLNTAALANGGTVQGARATLTTGAVTNSGTLTLSTGSDAARITAATIEQRAGGAIQSTGALTIDGLQSIANAGTIVATGDLTLAGSASRVALSSTADGLFQAGGVLTVTRGGQATLAGAMLADTLRLSFDDARVTGVVQADRDLMLTVGGALDVGGLVNARRALTLSAATLTNDGTVQGATGLALSGGALVNRGTIALLDGGAAVLDHAQLTNSGTIQSATGLTLRVRDTFDNSGRVLARDTLSLTTNGALTVNSATGAAIRTEGALTIGGGGTGTITLANAGAITARDTLAITAAGVTNAVTGVIQGAAGAAITADTLANAGQVVLASAAGQAGTLTLGGFTNSGSVQSAGALALTAARGIDNGGTLLALGAMTIGGGGALVQRGATAAIDAGGALTIDAPSLSLQLQDGRVRAGALTASVADLTSAAAIQSGGALALTVRGDLANDGTLLGLGTGTITVGGELANTGGLQIDDGLTLRAATLTNSGTLIAANTAGKAASLDVGTVRNRDGATLYAADALTVNTGGLDNAGRLLAQGPLTLSIGSGALGNAATGTIRSTGALAIGAGAVTQDGTLSGDTLALSLASLTSSGATRSAGSLALTTSGDATIGGTLLAGGRLDLTAATLTNSGAIQGTLGSAIAATRLANAAGAKLVLSGDDAASGTIAAGSITNAGSIQSRGAARLTATTLANGGTILAAGALDLLAVAGGTLAITNAGADAAIQAGTTATVGAAGATPTASYTGSGGATLSAATLAMTLDRFANGGTIQARDALRLSVARDVAITAGGKLLSLGTTAIAGSNLLNEGAIELRGATAWALTGGVDNAGLLNLLGDAGTLSVTSILNRRAGTIHTAGAMTLAAGTIDNDGTLLSDGTLTIRATSSGPGVAFTNRASGIVSAAGAFTFGSAGTRDRFTSRTGSRLIAGDGSAIRATDMVNDGLTQANGALSVDATAMSVGGSLIATGALVANASDSLTLVRDGVIQGDTAALRAARLAIDGTFNAATGTSGGGSLTGDKLTVGASGRVQSRGDLTLALSTALSLDGMILANGLIDLRPGSGGFQFDMGASSALQSGGAFTLDLPTLDLTLGSGATLAAKSVALRVRSLDSGATIQANDDLTVDLGGGAMSLAGTLYAGGSATITAGDTMLRSDGGIQGLGGVTLSVATFANAGTIIAGQEATASTAQRSGRVTVAATRFTNDGTIRATDRLTASARDSFANNGLLYAGEWLMPTLSAANGILENSGTMLAPRIQLQGSVDNLRTGVIRGTSYIEIFVDQLMNSGTIIADEPTGQYTSYAGLLVNDGTGIIQLGSTGAARTSLNMGRLVNEGLVQSLGNLSLSLGTSVSNAGRGRILTAGDLAITAYGAATTIDSDGRIEAGGTLRLGTAAAGFQRITLGKTVGSAATVNATSGALYATTLEVGSASGATGTTVTMDGALDASVGTLAMANPNSALVMGDGSRLALTSALVNRALIYSPGDLTISTAGITNAVSGSLAAGGLLTLTGNGFGSDFDNSGTVFGDRVTIASFGNFRNLSGPQAQGTVEANAALSITTPTSIVNNHILRVGNGDGLMTLDSSLIRNRITGGDTRYWNYEGTGFDIQEGLSSNAGVKGSNTGTSTPPIDITAAVPGSWSEVFVKKVELGDNIGYFNDNFYFSATFKTRQYYRTDPASLFKPVMASNGTMRLISGGTVENVGGTISARVLDFAVNGILNDSLPVRQQSWTSSWINGASCTGAFGCTAAWNSYTSYRKSVITAETLSLDSISTSITAALFTGRVGNITLNGNSGVNSALSLTTGGAPSAVVHALSADGTASADVEASTTSTPATGAGIAPVALSGQTGAVGTSAVSGGVDPVTGVATQAVATLPGGATGGAITPGSGIAADGTTPGFTAGPGTAIDLLTGAAASTVRATLRDVQANPVSTSNGANGEQLHIQGVTIPLPVSPNALYVIATQPDARYLIERNPRFALGTAGLGSDAIARQLGINPDLLVRRLGDGAYENYLVTQQVIAQTGIAALVRAETSDQQAARLMDGSVAVAKRLGLSYGKPLTGAQQAALDTDIVWMVETEVRGVKVLAPVVYLSRATKAKFQPGNAVFAADYIDLDAQSVTNKGGVIAGSKSLNLRSVGDITNTGGLITGGVVSLKSTQGSIINRGVEMASAATGATGGIVATDSMNLVAAKDITVLGAEVRSGGDMRLEAGNDVRFGTIDSTGYATTATGDVSTVRQIGGTLATAGNLSIASGRDTTFTASQMDVAGDARVDAGGKFGILAGQNVTETTTSTSSSGLGVGGGLFGSTTTTGTSFSGRNVASNVNVGGKLTVGAKDGTTIQGSNVTTGGDFDTQGGRVSILQGNDVDRSTTTTTTITYGRVAGKDTVTDASVTGSSSAYSKDKQNAAGAATGASTSTTAAGDVEIANVTTTRTDEARTTAVGSNIRIGGQATLGGTGLLLQGSSLHADKGVTIDAPEIQILAAKNTYSSTTTTDTTTTGLMGSSRNSAGANAEAKATASLTSQARAEAGASAESDNKVDLVRTSSTSTTRNDVTHTGASLTSGTDITLKGAKMTVTGSTVDAARDVLLDVKQQTYNAATDSSETTTTTSNTSAGLYANGNSNASAHAYANQIGAQAAANVAVEGSAGVTTTHTTSTATDGSTTAVVSQIRAGRDLTRAAEGKISDEGTQIEAGRNFSQSAGSYDSRAARDTTYSSSSSQSDTGRLGVYAGADAGATAGAGAGGATGVGASASVGVKGSYTHDDATTNDATSTARVSQIKAGGGVSMTSVGKTSMEGTTIQGAGDVALTAGSLDYTAARNTQTSSSSSTSGTAGVKVGIDATKAARLEVDGSYSGRQSESANSQAVAGGIGAGGNLTVRTTEGDARFEGTKLAAGGKASIDSAGSVTFSAARDTYYSKDDTQDASLTLSTEKSARGGLDASAGFTTDMTRGTAAQAGSITGGGGVTITAAKDASFEGTKTGGADVKAGGTITRTAAENTSESTSYSAELAGSSEGKSRSNADAPARPRSNAATDVPTRARSGATSDAPTRPRADAVTDLPTRPRADAVADVPVRPRSDAVSEPVRSAAAASGVADTSTPSAIRAAVTPQTPTRGRADAVTEAPVRSRSDAISEPVRPAAVPGVADTPIPSAPRTTVMPETPTRTRANAVTEAPVRAISEPVRPAAVPGVADTTTPSAPRATVTPNAPTRALSDAAADAPARSRSDTVGEPVRLAATPVVADTGAPSAIRTATTPDVPTPTRFEAVGGPSSSVAPGRVAALSDAVSPGRTLDPAATPTITRSPAVGSIASPAVVTPPSGPSTTPAIAGAADARSPLRSDTESTPPVLAGVPRVTAATGSVPVAGTSAVRTPVTPTRSADPMAARTAGSQDEPVETRARSMAVSEVAATRQRGVAMSENPQRQERARVVTERPYMPVRETDPDAPMSNDAPDGTRTRSNDVTTRPMTTLAEIERAEKAGDIGSWQAGDNRWLVAQDGLRAMLDQAPAAKREADAISDQIAKDHDGAVSKALPKSEVRALEKIAGDYGYDAARIRDLARNTIMVKGEDIGAVVRELRARDANAIVKVVDGATDPLGYSGANVVLKTPSGLTAEIQVNSPRMIYAKEGRDTAIAIMGPETYERIKRETGVEGGLGHKFYEDWRRLPASSPEARRIAEESRAYYARFR